MRVKTLGLLLCSVTFWNDTKMGGAVLRKLQ